MKRRIEGLSFLAAIYAAPPNKHPERGSIDRIGFSFFLVAASCLFLAPISALAHIRPKRS